MSEADGQKFLKNLDKKLWTAADRLRANLDAAVYKHAVLGLIFLKYVSDAFELRQRALEDHLRDAGHDIPGFCKSASLDEIAEHGYVLTPGRYVGAEEVEDDGVPFAEKMEGLTRELATQFHESEKLQSAIRGTGTIFQHRSITVVS
ncbi:type I restriction-modification system subunit M N-terminal domain-containing protein [Rosistilla oblonga]|uniref:N6 adenine-specific DNA methyltransferase N-terminal domain-containing protein n=1 Tax=Rosistilla oblonga TaxID=2527990 RepID=A0A518IVU8_9BACT|nr:type I restriction-modification system subunit M N-terminal domain-containing protein [Rosistilla oblonga]QDV57207.1 hypothetical protein Mal33_32110 [Rosistilla oblonga]